jgi:putative transposase
MCENEIYFVFHWTHAMSNYRRAYSEGGTYFFTVVTERRQAILINPDVRTALRAAIQKVRHTHPFVIDAWVLLPDHLHCIWTLPEGDFDFSTRWKMIKREVSVACAHNYQRSDLNSIRRREKHQSTLWQQGFWEHLIRDEHDFQAHMDYLHFNPVKHGLSEAVIDWPWSSFHRQVEQEIYPANWAGTSNAFSLSHDEQT